MRVFHRLGDYQHKHKNRMKFLIKQLGWERFQTEVLQEYEAVARRGGQSLPFAPDAPPVEEAPEWPRPRRARRRRDRARATASAVRGPGFTPTVTPALQVQRAAYLAWQRTNVRPQKQPGYVLVTDPAAAGRLHRRADAHHRRPGGGLRRRRRAHHAGPEPGVPLGADRRGRGALRAAGGGRSRRRRRRDRARHHELSRRGVLQAGGHAVARAGQPARRASRRSTRSSSPRRRTSSSRSAAARTAAASTTSRPSASRAACASSTARPCRSTS